MKLAKLLAEGVMGAAIVTLHVLFVLFELIYAMYILSALIDPSPLGALAMLTGLVFLVACPIFVMAGLLRARAERRGRECNPTVNADDPPVEGGRAATLHQGMLEAKDGLRQPVLHNRRQYTDSGK